MSSQEKDTVLDERARRSLGERARRMQPDLAGRGVRVVALTWVDNSGISRVKAVPVDRLEHAAAWGVGASGVFDGYLFDDSAVSGEHVPGVVGDLRLHPDLDRLTVLAAQPGWAWAPADRYDQQGVPHPIDARTAAKDAVAALAGHGYAARMAFEVEWVIGEPGTDGFVPAVHGPAYGMARLVGRSDYLRDVVDALGAQGVPVDQIHPEYAPGQMELSVAAADPVTAADTNVLVRETIRAVSAAHGLRVSFSPKVLADGVGNGGHVHLSLTEGERNLFAGGAGPFGLAPAAQAFTAGILRRLPALLAIGAPSVISYLRLVPQHWAGAFAAWGLENRETAMRLVTGARGSQDRAANVEVKCFDETANPYLVVAALIHAGLAGIGETAGLPEPVDVDPALLSPEERARQGIEALPGSLAEAVAAFEADGALTTGLGTPLASTIVDVRKGEISLLAGVSPEEIAAAMRWVH
jgi:glutamine synthetase